MASGNFRIYMSKEDAENLFPVCIWELDRVKADLPRELLYAWANDVVYLDAEGYKQFMARQSLHKEEISNVVKTDFGGKLR